MRLRYDDLMMRILGLLLVLWIGLCPTSGRAQADSSPPIPDADLAARLSLAAVPSVSFRQVATQTTHPAEKLASIACPHAASGLCDINWKSAPSQWRSTFAGSAADAAAIPSDRMILRTNSGLPLVWITDHEVMIAIDLRSDDLSSSGGRIRRWPYFNYLLYVAACHAARQTPLSFAKWPHSPLLGVHSPSLSITLVSCVWLICGLLFVLGRLPRARFALWKKDWLAALRAARSVQQPQQESTPHDAVSRRANWNEVGFTRPLSGLLTLLGSMFLLIGPYFALQSYLSGSVQPFPEADGLWKNTGDTLFILWLTFDMGTQTAVVKYFAEHRPKQPEEALKDVQFYVWWQIFARTVEATLLILVALRVLPSSSYAMYAPFALLYAATALPPITTLPKLLCQAMQRFDYLNLLDFSEARVLSFVVPIPFVLLGRSWGLSHPQFGEAFGAAIGMGIGSLATQAVVFSIGVIAIKKLGLPFVPMLLPQFDVQTVKRQLGFGFKVTMGQEPFRLTSFLESLIIMRWLADFPVWLGIRDMIHNRLQFLFFFAWSFYQSALPAVSEAAAAGKKKLIQYYISRYLQFGFLFSAVVFSLLVAIGPRYVLVALGPQWQGASDFLVVGCLSGLLLPLAWLSDSLQQGAGRPGTTTVVMLIEQGLRLMLLLIFVPRLQFLGIYVALLLALILKCVIGWWLNHRRIVSLHVPVKVTVLLPLFAGLVNFLCWRGVVLLVSPTSWLGMMTLFFVAGAGSFVVGFFALGLLGGLDQQAVRELSQAATMSALVRPICVVLSESAQLGSRLSPWPATESPLVAPALLEAAELASELSKESTESAAK